MPGALTAGSIKVKRKMHRLLILKPSLLLAIAAALLQDGNIITGGIVPNLDAVTGLLSL